MSNYTKTTNFATKDALASGNPAKIVKGTEIDTEFNNIAVASGTKADKASPVFTGTVTLPVTNADSLSIGGDGVTVTGIKDEDDMASNSATKLASQQSIKAYVDSQVTAQDLDVTDGTTSISIDLDSEALSLLGGTGVTSTASGNGVTMAIDGTVATLSGSQTLTNKTLATPAVTGALTTNSTIDGRDVAADGTKLDTVETNADVTDTTNVTAAGALMDSEVTNLAQVKAFDSTDYATAAQGTTADAALPKAGGAMTGAITTNSTFDGRDVATDGTKLDGIEALADVTDATNVTAAGALMDSELTSIASVKALNQGVATTDSPDFAALNVNGTATMDGLTVDKSSQATIVATSDSTVDVRLVADTSLTEGSIRTSGTTPNLGFYVGGTKYANISGGGDISFYEDTGTTAKLTWDASAELLTTTGLDVTGTATMDGLSVDRETALTYGSIDINGTNDSSIRMYNSAGTANFRKMDIRYSAATGYEGLYFRSINDANNDFNNIARFDTKTGDISFYEDTGTTAKLFWDASAEYLSVGSTTGTFAPINYIGSNGRLGINNGNTAGGTKIQSFAATNANGYLAFEGWDKEYMRIDSSGNVGIGTSLPSRELHISKDGQNGVRLTSTVFGADYGLLSSVGGQNGFGIYDYNASGYRFNIDSSGNVGIGTDLPSQKLEVRSTTQAVLRIRSDAGSITDMGSDATGTYWRNYSPSKDTFRWQLDDGTEAMRIDSSGNLLVGTTDGVIWNEAATDTSKEGVVIEPKSIQISRFQDTPLLINRQGNDGFLQVFAKDGTTVGSIGSRVTNLYTTYTANGFGLTGTATTNGVIPSLNGGVSNGAVDLGGSAARFKDLYLSGGVYLGGTGAANKLDDYEEGTFTPVYQSVTNPSGVTYDSGATYGSYTKVGNLVTVVGRIRTDGITSVGSGDLRIGGLPFTVSSSVYAPASLAISNAFASNNPITGYGNVGSTYIVLMYRSSITGQDLNSQCSDLGVGGNDNSVAFSMSYIV